MTLDEITLLSLLSGLAGTPIGVIIEATIEDATIKIVMVLVTVPPTAPIIVRIVDLVINYGAK